MNLQVFGGVNDFTWEIVEVILYVFYVLIFSLHIPSYIKIYGGSHESFHNSYESTKRAALRYFHE